jgi:hypothetical protein
VDAGATAGAWQAVTAKQSNEKTSSFLRRPESRPALLDSGLRRHDGVVLHRLSAGGASAKQGSIGSGRGFSPEA